MTGERDPSPLAGEGGPASAGPDEGAPGIGRALRGARGETLRTHAREMRKAPTETEKILWHILRGRRFSGYKFRRQAPIGNYIADFVCYSERLIVEADGSQHAESPRDAARDAWFASEGFRVRRFWNAEILQNRQMVADTLWADLAAPSSVSPSASHLLPRGEKGGAAPVLPFLLAGEGGPASAGPDEGAPREEKRLDGARVETINADLSAGLRLIAARQLSENRGICIEGLKKYGPFDVSGARARAWLKEPLNVNGKPNSNVLRPWINGMDLMRNSSDTWVVDFSGVSLEEATLYEQPFKYVEANVLPVRKDDRAKRTRENWWLFERDRPVLREKLGSLRRFIATPVVSKHRVFVWLDARCLVANLADAIARDDDATFGVLHSRFHEAWALRLGTSLEDRPRYTPTTTFETFPFPEGLTPNIPAKNYADTPRAKRIAKAAKKLDELRRNWLNPPDLIDIVPEVVAGYPDRILPKNAEAAAKLRTRTLTNLYNERPNWLTNAHADLDRAVALAYGWPEDISTEDALARLLALNLERAKKQ